MNDLDYDVSSFKKINSTEALNILNSDDLNIIYIGRSTCPYCRKFVKKLNSLKDKIPTTIYYIDSSNQSDDHLSSLREKYNVKTVPGYIVNKDGMTTVLCDSSASEEELIQMMD